MPIFIAMSGFSWIVLGPLIFINFNIDFPDSSVVLYGDDDTDNVRDEDTTALKEKQIGQLTVFRITEWYLCRKKDKIAHSRALPRLYKPSHVQTSCLQYPFVQSTHVQTLECTNLKYVQSSFVQTLEYTNTCLNKPSFVQNFQIICQAI